MTARSTGLNTLPGCHVPFCLNVTKLYNFKLIGSFPIQDMIKCNSLMDCVASGETMSLTLALNLEPIFQLTFVGLIMIAGPVVVFLLAFRGGDL